MTNAWLVASLLLVSTTTCLGQVSGMDLPEIPAHLGGSPDQRDAPPETPPTDPSDEPPPTFFGEELGDYRRLVYVIDVSGSMGPPPGNEIPRDDPALRINRAKAELVRSIGTLRRDQYFNVAWFDHVSDFWRRSGLHEANEENKASAIAWVMRLEAGGGTNTGPVVAHALNLLNQSGGNPVYDRVMLLTDGAANGSMPGCCPLGMQTPPKHEEDCQGSGPSAHRKFIRDHNARRIPIDAFGFVLRTVTRDFCRGVSVIDSGGNFIEVP